MLSKSPKSTRITGNIHRFNGTWATGSELTITVPITTTMESSRSGNKSPCCRSYRRDTYTLPDSTNLPLSDNPFYTNAGYADIILTMTRQILSPKELTSEGAVMLHMNEFELDTIDILKKY